MNQPFGTGPAPSLPPAIDGELRLDNAAIDRAFRWLLREGRMQPSGRELLQGLTRELAEGGFPLMRGFLAMPTLHPQIASVAYRWSRATPEVEAFTRMLHEARAAGLTPNDSRAQVRRIVVHDIRMNGPL